MSQVSDKKAIYEVIKSISGQNNILTIPRIYIDLTGSVKSALFLSQCVYWADKMGKRFYKTYEDWQEEIGLTRRDLDKARKDCSEWVKTEVHRANGLATLHYFVDMDLLVIAVSTVCTNRTIRNVQNVQSGLYESYNPLTETTTEITTDINIMQNSLQEEISSPAKKNGDNMNKEEYMERIAKSTAIGLTNGKSDYAQFPEELVPVVERMDKVWRFSVPGRKSKNGSYAQWVESCRQLLDACGEYNVELLDEMRSVWESGLNSHGGIAPYNVSGPQSLLKAVQGFAASKRRGEKFQFTYPGYVKQAQARQSLLDV